MAIFGSLLSSQINGSTLPPPVDEITNKTTIAPNGEFEFFGLSQHYLGMFYHMAILVVEFSREEYKIRKVFG